MTTDQIERLAEGRMDRLDNRLMLGTLTQAEYEKEVRELNKWAEEHYRRIKS